MGKGLRQKREEKKGKKKSESPRFECFHNGIILIVICFQVLQIYSKFLNILIHNKLLYSKSKLEKKTTLLITLMKRILGLDLGVTSIGWAYVKEAEMEDEISSIEKIGVRVNPLTTDEQTNFEKGKTITTNANRTLARSARRNLQRYKLRRENLIQILKDHNWIDEKSLLSENGNHSTFETYRLRATSVNDKISLNEFARVLLMINKKRGYKSSRKVNNSEEGQLVDGMDVAKKLYEENITPGQFVLHLLKSGKKKVPEFYRSDLQSEFDKIWNFQKQFYPEILTDEFKESIKSKGQKVTSQIFYTTYKFNTAENKGTREEKKFQNYYWRNEALSKQLAKEEVAYILADINGQTFNSSGYLGAISDRSKELFFNKQTVGQYLYQQIQDSPHTRLKNQVFYRQDYLDEFETIWEKQASFHDCLTPALKQEIRDIVIFYQRKLKSQKNLISICEFENRQIIIDGKTKKVGLRVAPKASPLFQEFKIWQQLHNVRLKNKKSGEIIELSQEAKELLFSELNLKGKMSSSKVLSLLENGKQYELNYEELEGNNTNAAISNALISILDYEGYDIKESLKIKLNKDEITISDLDAPSSNIKDMFSSILKDLKIDDTLIDFDAELEGKLFENQTSYAFWHLLYSYVEDDSKTGMDLLHKLLQEKYGFKLEHAKILGNIVFTDGYGNLSTKAMREIYPYIKENEYSVACEQANYRHSKNSLTKEELENRELKPRLDILQKNSLRNPVVEKILNQMVNVINTLIDTENEKLKLEGLAPNFQFDEIRIELARELKKNAKERGEMTRQINTAKKQHEDIIKLLQREDQLMNPTRNDIIRYKLYQELKNNGYKNLYTGEYIERKDLFTNKYDIDHIIPQSRLFDDSFSNKTLCPRKINIEKGNKTAYDYVLDTFGQSKADEFELNIKSLSSSKEEGLSKAKAQKLIKKGSEIGEGFIERDLRDSQYIAKKAKEMLFEISRSIVTTSGSITDRLRDDWGLVNVMKELNLPKYKAVGRTEIIEVKGNKKEIIQDWTKRNDHRHHAMDALTIAFTKRSYIQYLNNLNARKEEHQSISNVKGRKAIGSSQIKLTTKDILGIEEKETKTIKDALGNRKRIFIEPLPQFRQKAKELLSNVLISHKAKNKVVTINKNKISGNSSIQKALTPRGQLHKETVYGKYQYYQSKEEKIGPKFDLNIINLVSNPLYRELLLARLEANENDPKKAFGGKNALNKNPIYLSIDKTEVLPEKVKLTWLESDFSIRKDITPDNFKDAKSIEKVLDLRSKELLLDRLIKYGNDSQKAFSDLEKNPIWFNEEKGIAMKRVKISGVTNAKAIHFKKDKEGKNIQDSDGNLIPTDYISTGNNHHVAIYVDEKGNLQEKVVSFFEAVIRVNEDLPIIDKSFNEGIGWKFLFTMKQNELFVFPNEKTGFNPEEIDLLDPENKGLISPNLFRVQKITTGDYTFRNHLETTVEVNTLLKNLTYKRCTTSGLKKLIKIRTNHLGEIVQIGEY